MSLPEQQDDTRLDADEIGERARQRTVHDFDSDSYREGLEPSSRR